MPPVPFLWWLALHLARRPLTWAVALGAAALPAAIAAAGPLTISGQNGPSEAAIYDLAFLSAMVGGMLGGGAVASSPWLFGLLNEPARYTSELICVAFPALALGAIATVSASLSAPGTQLHAFTVPSLLAWTHLSALMVILLRIPGAAGPRLLAPPLVCWALPAVMAGSSWSGNAVTLMLDPRSWMAAATVGSGARLASACLAGALVLAGLSMRPTATAARI